MTPTIQGVHCAPPTASSSQREFGFDETSSASEDPSDTFRADAAAQWQHCDEQLGMGPAEYARRWRMQLVHRTLLKGNTEAASISAVARCRGFRSLGSFAASYRALYGELPSVTLRRGLRRGAPLVTLGRSGTKLLLTALSWINAGVIAISV